MLRYCLKHGLWKTLVAPMNEQLIKAHSLVKRFLTGICTVFIRKGVREILLTIFLILPIKDCILLLMNWFSFMVTQAFFCSVCSNSNCSGDLVRHLANRLYHSMLLLCLQTKPISNALTLFNSSRYSWLLSMMLSMYSWKTVGSV